MPKRILVIGFSKIAADARISKFVKALNKDFEITTLAFGQGLYEHHFIKLKQAKKNKGPIESESLKSILSLQSEGQLRDWVRSRMP